MNFMTRLAVLFYMFSLLFVGAFVLLFVSNFIDVNYIIEILQDYYTDSELKMWGGIFAGCILVLNFMFANAISDRRLREKTIAFDNPSGRVSVALTALEDLVRRVIAGVPEVKEVKTRITASKRKGLDISARLILKTDVNIPEMTSDLQDLVKKKIHRTIGVEEDVTVRVDVVKIILGGSKTKRIKETENEEELEPNVPFQGYRP